MQASVTRERLIPVAPPFEVQLVENGPAKGLPQGPEAINRTDREPGEVSKTQHYSNR